MADSKNDCIAVLFHRIGPYHFARLRAAGERLNIIAIEFSGVDETYAWDAIPGAENFQRLTLFQDADSLTRPTGEVVSRVNEALNRCQPRVVVIPGWSNPASLAALQWCATRYVPVVMMSETTAWDEPRKWWKECWKKSVIDLCSVGLVGGKPHRDYLEYLGLPLERIFLGYDVVDNNHFARGAAEARSRKQEVQKQYVLPENYFLASARFIKKKNLSQLIQAYAMYRRIAANSHAENQGTEPWSLVLLGDGPLRSVLQFQLSTLNLNGHVRMPGFRQYHELPAYFGLAGAFIHSSTTEQWGLVVNEAMASGLPVLVSNRCGCAPDLVMDGVNGFTFDPNNVEEIAQKMVELSTSPSRLSAFGTVSREIIAKWSPQRFAEGLSRRSKPPYQDLRVLQLGST